MTRRRLKVAGVAAMLVSMLAPAPGARAQANERAASGSLLRTFETPYYILHTDMNDDVVREADLRMTRMFEEYQRRTAGFSGQVKTKLPFYLYHLESDYNAAGGPKGSDGVYMQSALGAGLMAVVGDRPTARTWHVVQHEGFHQFLAAAIKGDVPIWANEGLAEYFGEGLWTGDGFVTGLIPEERRQAVLQGMSRGTFKSFARLMAMSPREWGDRLEYSNYDEAWAMIQFLAHGDNGKYQQAFQNYMTQISKGTPANQAWDAIFGRDAQAFEARFAQWWTTMAPNPSATGYAQAVVLTETSFAARAYLLRANFPDLDTFLRKYQPPELGLGRDLWLPPRLFNELSDTAISLGTWKMEQTPNGTPRLICELNDGGKMIGTFSVGANKVTGVAVQVIGSPTTTRSATAPTLAIPGR